MQSLFEFFYRYRALILFLVLEIFCGWMVVRFNTYQSSAFFNSSNVLTGAMLQTKDNISYYFKLRVVNNALAEENTKLREQLQQAKQQRLLYDERKVDTARIYQYSYITAKVINNSTNKASNFFTLDKGTKDGIKPGMGVLSVNGGMAGKVKNCSNHYSTVVSMLNEKNQFDARVTRGDVAGIIEWKWRVGGVDPTEVELVDVAKHHKIFEGDSVVTSGSSDNLPYGVLIGTIKSIVDDGKKYNIKVKLTTDFTALSFVYVINNKLEEEKKLLEESLKNK
jgi:rod shape-determining protein MreC